MLQPNDLHLHRSSLTCDPPDVEVWSSAYRILETITDEVYSGAMPPLSDFGIGSHIRHCLEFYQCFFVGIEPGLVDYDRRERNLRIATDRRAALMIIRGLMDRLRDFEVDSRSLNVYSESEGRGEGDRPQVSSVERERTFLLSHTVHHFAIVGLLLKLQGVEPPADFGVAPSTLAHWRRQESSCVQ